MAFGLPVNYQENEAITAIDDGVDYWTPARVDASKRYQWSVYRLAERLARARRARSVLDVGCGPATKLEALFAGFDRYGVDQAGTIELCHALGRQGTFVEVDLSSGQDAPGVPEADVVVCADVVEHLADPGPVLEFVRKHCSETGLIILSTPDRERLLGPGATRPSNPSHVREWTSAEFTELLLASGLSIVERHSHLPFRLGFDLMTARWLMERLRSRRSLRSNQVVVCQPTAGL